MLGRVLKGSYRIDSMLGRGGMGVVYRGTQLTLGKPVAIKMLLAQSHASEGDYTRFKREALLASSMIHPGVAQVFDYGKEERTPFIIMEFVEGVELTEVIQNEAPLPPQRALAIMHQLVSVLQEAHRHSIMHRDLKPSNLRLMRYVTGGPIYLKVLDFGIAKQLDQDGGNVTASGILIGTPRYMAPEQADSGVKSLDARADQYSAGIIFYELLSGKVPFEATTLHGLLMAHMTKAPPPLPESVPPEVRAIVERMLQKDPAARYADPGELEREIAACENLLSSGVPLPKVRSRSGALRPQRRIPLLVAGGAVLLVGLAAAGGLLLHRPRTPELSRAASLPDLARPDPTPLAVKTHAPVEPPVKQPETAVEAPGTDVTPRGKGIAGKDPNKPRGSGKKRSEPGTVTPAAPKNPVGPGRKEEEDVTIPVVH